jgi:hypothetical protein
MPSSRRTSTKYADCRGVLGGPRQPDLPAIGSFSASAYTNTDLNTERDADASFAEVANSNEAWLATARDAGKPIPEPRHRPAIYAR